jgi:hypothetical protein
LQVGDQVYYYCPRKYRGRCPKWQKMFTGPWSIVRVIDSYNFVISRSATSKPLVVHRDKLKKVTDMQQVNVGNGNVGIPRNPPGPSGLNTEPSIDSLSDHLMSDDVQPNPSDVPVSQYDQQHYSNSQADSQQTQLYTNRNEQQVDRYPVRRTRLLPPQRYGDYYCYMLSVDSVELTPCAQVHFSTTEPITKWAESAPRIAATAMTGPRSTQLKRVTDQLANELHLGPRAAEYLAVLSTTIVQYVQEHQAPAERAANYATIPGVRVAQRPALAANLGMLDSESTMGQSTLTVPGNGEQSDATLTPRPSLQPPTIVMAPAMNAATRADTPTVTQFVPWVLQPLEPPTRKLGHLPSSYELAQQAAESRRQRGLPPSDYTRLPARLRLGQRQHTSSAARRPTTTRRWANYTNQHNRRRADINGPIPTGFRVEGGRVRSEAAIERRRQRQQDRLALRHEDPRSDAATSRRQPESSHRRR